MKKIIALIVFIFLAAGISHVHGQILKDYAKKRKETANESATERVDKEIAKGVNKGLDKIFGKNSGEAKEGDDSGEGDDSSTSNDSGDSGRSSRSSSGLGMGGLMSAMGLGGAVDIKDSYNFDAKIEMTIANIDDDGEIDDPVYYISYIDADSRDYGIAFTEKDQDAEMLMIFDTENNLMVTLMESDGEKTGFAVGFDEETSAAMAESYAESEEDYDATANPYNVKKTGKTKKIIGYSCDEYRTEDENSVVSMWVTNDLGKKIDKAFMRNGNFSGMFLYAYYTDGFVMEYIIEDKDDKDKTIMTITDIDVDNVEAIKTGGYTIMNLGSMEEMEDEGEEE